MEANELPQFDPNVDYSVILPIHQKRTIAFVNHFVTSTVSFLNNFCESCESRLIEFEYKLGKVEASLLILEAQLASIPDIDSPESPREVPTSVVQPEPMVPAEGLDLPDIGVEEEKPAPPQQSAPAQVQETGPPANSDPRFARFFKMVQFGVPAQAVKLKMTAEGVDANILDKPNAVIPGHAPPTVDPTNSGDTTDSSN